ncbi:hypothetical protein B566_EDAN010068 [Ephemera danica]|nr:hypothetical protein B566_EDAN010068 [Ephemera danica]
MELHETEQVYTSSADLSPALYHHATELVAYRPLRRYLPRMPARRPSPSERRGLRALFGVFLGSFLGFLVASQLRSVLLGQEGSVNGSCSSLQNSHRSPSMSATEEDLVFAGLRASDTVHNSSRALLFVGVMTAQKYLDTRAKAVYETWGRELPGRMAFFSSATSVTSARIPLVRLPGVDDSYPPQKKSFLMLKYMYENFGDKFEWFMRADDDVYVRPERLAALLRSVDSRKAQFIGQAGRGSQEEFGLLSLEYDENFCMGGPGILMSRATLAKVAPHVSYCLRNLYTTHEDVELGRCVRRFAGVPCTWSYEVSH